MNDYSSVGQMPQCPSQVQEQEHQTEGFYKMCFCSPRAWQNYSGYLPHWANLSSDPSFRMIVSKRAHRPSRKLKITASFQWCTCITILTCSFFSGISGGCLKIRRPWVAGGGRLRRCPRRAPQRCQALAQEPAHRRSRAQISHPFGARGTPVMVPFSDLTWRFQETPPRNCNCGVGHLVIV